MSVLPLVQKFFLFFLCFINGNRDWTKDKIEPQFNIACACTWQFSCIMHASHASFKSNDLTHTGQFLKSRLHTTGIYWTKQRLNSIQFQRKWTIKSLMWKFTWFLLFRWRCCVNTTIFQWVDRCWKSCLQGLRQMGMVGWSKYTNIY